MLQQDLYSNLIGQGKKGGINYSKKVNQIETQIQLIKNKNNQLQKQSDNDIDLDIKKEIYKQSKFIQKQINKIKQLLTVFSAQFKDPTAKNKLKQLWKNASKEIQRNKVIMERYVNDAPSQSFLKDVKTATSSFIMPKNRNSKNYSDIQSNKNKNLPNMKTNNHIKPVSEQQYDQSQLKLQQQIQQQKKQLLNHLEQKNIKINKIMSQMALIVQEQGQTIDILTDNIKQAKVNTDETNNQLQAANNNQRKARRKYCCIAATLTILAIGLIGSLLILYFN